MVAEVPAREGLQQNKVSMAALRAYSAGGQEPPQLSRAGPEREHAHFCLELCGMVAIHAAVLPGSSSALCAES